MGYSVLIVDHSVEFKADYVSQVDSESIHEACDLIADAWHEGFPCSVVPTIEGTAVIEFFDGNTHKISGGVEEWIKAQAGNIEPGSFISCLDEESSLFRYYFTGEECIDQYPEITWPGE